MTASAPRTGRRWAFWVLGFPHTLTVPGRPVRNPPHAPGRVPTMTRPTWIREVGRKDKEEESSPGGRGPHLNLNGGETGFTAGLPARIPVHFPVWDHEKTPTEVHGRVSFRCGVCPPLPQAVSDERNAGGSRGASVQRRGISPDAWGHRLTAAGVLSIA